jgi:tetratricopeptide (TPR) repeat protein
VSLARIAAGAGIAALCLLLAAPTGAGGALSARASAQDGDAPPRALETSVPRMDTAAAQLAHARRIKRTMSERPEEDRAFWRVLAVEAYRAVRAYHPGAAAACAEASFRAGELLRAAGEADAAQEEFERARAAGAGTPFRARAALEIGHLHRRAGRSREALDLYLAVAGDGRAAAAHRDDAWLWAGRVWSDEGRVPDARRAWEGVARGGQDPLDRVLAFDWLALSWLEAGDLEAAAGVLDRCRVALSPLALEETELGERVRNALLRMRVVTSLQSAIERRASGEDSERPRKP